MLGTHDRLQARLVTLHAIGRALARPLDELDVLRSVHAELARAIDVSMCFFGRYNADGQSVCVIWQIHDGVELPGGTFPLGSGPTSRAIRYCQPQLIRNWSTKGPPVQVQYATECPSLPESSMAVPVVYDERVIGVLSVQTYEPDAYDEDDLALLQSAADQVAVALMAANTPAHASDLEPVLSSMDDALLVLDADGRVVRINRAARGLFAGTGGVVMGQPVDRPQSGRWPLGTREVTEQVGPAVRALKNGSCRQTEMLLNVDGTSVSCRASVLMKNDSPAGTVMVLRRLAAAS
jgi:GAF domain-containing protein